MNVSVRCEKFDGIQRFGLEPNKSASSGDVEKQVLKKTQRFRIKTY